MHVLFVYVIARSKSSKNPENTHFANGPKLVVSSSVQSWLCLKKDLTLEKKLFSKNKNCTKSFLFNVRSSLFPRKLTSHFLFFDLFYYILFGVIVMHSGSGSAKEKSYISCGSGSCSSFTTLLINKSLYVLVEH
jgi:hypothetical protein